MHPLFVQDFSANMTDLLLSLLDEKRLFQDQRLDTIKNVSCRGRKDPLIQSAEKFMLLKTQNQLIIIKIFTLS